MGGEFKKMYRLLIMLNLILFFGKKHFSFALIILGAACFFLSNVLFKIILTDIEYGQYSIVITYLSVMYILGLLGLEQIFLRYSTHSKANVISTQEFQIKLISWSIVLTPILGMICFQIYFSAVSINPYLLYFSSFSMVALLFIFNCFRLNTDFVLAQFAANFWRFSLLLIATLAFIYKKLNFENIINAILVSTVIIFLLTFIYCFRKIRFVFNKNVSRKDLINTAFQFFISIATFSVLIFGDRFLVEFKFSVQEFGNYFYLTNFFLAPFSIFQNYIGFKQLILFKKEFSIKSFNSFNKKFLLLGCVLGILLFGISYLVNQFKYLNFDFDQYTSVIILLIIMGIVRLYSASINSAFEAKTNIKSLQKANFVFIFFALLIISLSLFFQSLEAIVACIILVWLVRCIIMKKILLSQLNYA